jgi:hypothetical protein
LKSADGRFVLPVNLDRPIFRESRVKVAIFGKTAQISRLFSKTVDRAGVLVETPPSVFYFKWSAHG